MNRKQDNLDYAKGYGKNYADLRKKEYNHVKDYTVRELAVELLISSSTISKIENEKVYPTVEQVKAYKKFFHVSLDYLTGDTVYDKGFEYGLEKAWEIAKRILIPGYEKTYSRYELEVMFGKDIKMFGFTNMTVFEVMDKVELYEKQKAEKDKIKDGDEVRLDDGTKGVVVYSDKEGHLNVVNAYGGMRSYYATQVIKTGRHFPQMVEMMKEMRDNDGKD